MEYDDKIITDLSHNKTWKIHIVLHFYSIYAFSSIEHNTKNCSCSPTCDINLLQTRYVLASSRPSLLESEKPLISFTDKASNERSFPPQKFYGNAVVTSSSPFWRRRGMLFPPLTISDEKKRTRLYRMKKK